MATRTIIQAFAVLAVIVLLAVLVSGAGNTAFSNLTAAVKNTPSFVNPFDERISHNPPLIANTTASNPPDNVTNPGNVENCDASDDFPYFGCLTTHDGAESFVSIFGVGGGADGQFNVSEDAIPTNAVLPVLAVVITIECRTTSGTGDFQVILKSDIGGITFNSVTVRCNNLSGRFTDVVIANSFVPARPQVSQFTRGSVLIVASTFIGDVSFIQVSYVIATEPECTPADLLTYIGCLLTTAIAVFFRFIRLIVNAFVFFAQGISYLGGIMFALGAAFAVLFTLGAPSPFQEIIDLAIIALLIFVVLTVIQTIRGSEA